MFRRRTLALIVFVLCMAPAFQARADTVTLYPSYTGSEFQGSNQQAVLGNGAWQSTTGGKTSVYLTPEVLYGTGSSFTVGDLQSFSWQTFDPSTDADTNNSWYMNMYTAADGVDDDASWYGRRLTWEALYANNRNHNEDQWVQWQTEDPSENQLTMFDSNRTNAGFYGGPTLDVITSGPIDWSAYPTSGSTDIIDYRPEEVMYVWLGTGSGWGPDYEGYIDELKMEHNPQVTVDFEPTAEAIPEPATLALLGISALGLMVRRRRRSA